MMMYGDFKFSGSQPISSSMVTSQVNLQKGTSTQMLAAQFGAGRKLVFDTSENEKGNRLLSNVTSRLIHFDE